MTENVEVVGAAQATSSFAATFMMLALGVMLVSGLSIYVRKKRE
jgi:LPXTG-motif cell wall-anchored protein